MLNIFVGPENKPSEIITDSEYFFYRQKINDSIITRGIIKSIEDGTYLDSRHFIDRFGDKVTIECLSSTSKILLNVLHNPELCFNCSELGNNGFNYLLNCLNGMVYFEDIVDYEIEEVEDFDISNISVNGIQPQSIIELEDLLWR